MLANARLQMAKQAAAQPTETTAAAQPKQTV